MRATRKVMPRNKLLTTLARSRLRGDRSLLISSKPVLSVPIQRNFPVAHRSAQSARVVSEEFLLLHISYDSTKFVHPLFANAGKDNLARF